MGLSEFLEDAVRWVASHDTGGRPLWIVVPSLVPHATLLRQRLLSAGLGGVQTRASLPLRGTSAGIRLGRLFEVLAADGTANAVVRLLPYIRRGASDAPRGAAVWEARLSLRRAGLLLMDCGSHDDPDGPRRWSRRLQDHASELREAVRVSLQRECEESAARRTLAVERHRAERWLSDVKPLLPAIEALDQLLDQCQLEPVFDSLVDSISRFAEQWMLLPPDPPAALAIFREYLCRTAPQAHEASNRSAVERLQRALDCPMWVADDPGARVILSTIRPDHCEEAEIYHPASGSPLHFSSAVRPPAGPALDPERALQICKDLASDRWTTADGNLSGARGLLHVLGLSAERPLSASAFGLLLGCPYRFLLQRMARLGQGAGMIVTDRLEPIHQGVLFHRAAEQLFANEGQALCRCEGALADWHVQAERIADEVFATALHHYPLWGKANIDREREKLRVQMKALVSDEWSRGPREFAASEWRFGEPQAVEIRLPGGSVFIRGSIDRIDILASGGLSVRDLKTGMVPSLKHQPIHSGRDLQLGVYVLVLENGGFGPAHRVEEAVYVQAANPRTVRSFHRESLQELRRQTREWLEIGRGLLEAACFPRTTNAWDCRDCPFQLVCGEAAPMRSRTKLQGLSSDGVLHRFLSLKNGRFPGSSV